MEKHDYQAIRELEQSKGWEILKQELEKKVKDIENQVFSCRLEDLTWDDIVKQMNVINYKKAERVYLLDLINLPERLLSTQIKK